MLAGGQPALYDWLEDALMRSEWAIRWMALQMLAR